MSGVGELNQRGVPLSLETNTNPKRQDSKNVKVEKEEAETFGVWNLMRPLSQDRRRSVVKNK